MARSTKTPATTGPAAKSGAPGSKAAGAMPRVAATQAKPGAAKTATASGAAAAKVTPVAGGGGVPTVKPAPAVATPPSPAATGSVGKVEVPKAPATTTEPERATAAQTTAAQTPVAPATVSPKTVTSSTEGKRGPGFVPLVLGGLLAGAIGYAIPTFLMPPPQADMSRLDALEARVSGLPTEMSPPAPVDLSSLEAAQEALSGQLEDVTARLDALESRGSPADAPTPAPVDLDPLRAEVETVSDAVTGLRADLESRLTAVESGLSDAVTLAETVGDEAEVLARETARNQVTVALQSGGAFAEPLGVLGEAPEALASVAQTGIATSAELIAEFPPLAREALRAARSAEPAAGVGSLFRNAFNARALTPQEGDDPDAVLSRAEAAVRADRLDEALTEIASLPEVAQAVLSDWTGRVRARADALAAAQDFLKDG